MGGPAMIVAGLGCRKGCDGAELAALVREAAARGGCRVDALAAPMFKGGEAGLHAAASALGVPLVLVARAALAAVAAQCPTGSARALAAVGVASVAEGSALAAAGPDARLLLPRIGTARATCALAEGDGA